MSETSTRVTSSVQGLREASLEVAALLEGRDLPGTACAVAYLSFSDPASCVAAYDCDGTLTPLIGFLPLPMRGPELIAAIAGIDNNGPRLIANYCRAFPEDAERLREFDPGMNLQQTAAPGWLLAACSLALGLDESDMAAAFGSRVDSIGIDTFVVEVDRRYVLDGRRVLRSLMSYRIGGVAKETLGRSIFESLGHFVSDAVGRLLRDWRGSAIVLAGDLFERNVSCTVAHGRTWPAGRCRSSPRRPGRTRARAQAPTRIRHAGVGLGRW